MESKVQVSREAIQLSSLVPGAPKAAATWYKRIHKIVVVIAIVVIVVIVVAVVIVNYMYKMVVIYMYKWWMCDAKLNTQQILTGT